MSPVLVGQVLINGLQMGLFYALLAVGFSLIYGVGRIIFCGHGEIYMMGAVLNYFLVMRLGLPYPLAIIIVSLAVGVFGLILDRGLFRRFLGDDFGIFIVSLGLAIIIQQVFLELFGGHPMGISTQIRGTVKLLGMTLSRERLVTSLISVAIIVALHFFFHRVKAGQAMRAVAQDPEAAALYGINKSAILSLTFFLSLALAAAAAGLIAPIFSVSTAMGSRALLNTFIVVTLGGLGSFPGAILGGLLIGILHAVGGLFIGEITYLTAFVIIIVFLVVRPRGFFGHT